MHLLNHNLDYEGEILFLCDDNLEDLKKSLEIKNIDDYYDNLILYRLEKNTIERIKIVEISSKTQNEIIKELFEVIK